MTLKLQEVYGRFFPLGDNLGMPLSDCYNNTKNSGGKLPDLPLKLAYPLLILLPPN